MNPHAHKKTPGRPKFSGSPPGGRTPSRGGLGGGRVSSLPPGGGRTSLEAALREVA